MDGNGEPYEFWEKLELRAYDNGHGYMEGIFDPGAADTDPVSRAHFESLTQAHGEERAREILGMNRHNTIIYGSGSPHTVFQQFRVIRPICGGPHAGRDPDLPPEGRARRACSSAR